MMGFLTVAAFLGTGQLHPGSPRTMPVIAAIVIGASALSFHGVFTTLVGEISEPGQIGTVVGTASTMFKISKIMFPPFFGKLVDITHSYYTGWNILVSLALISTVLLLVMVREPGQQQPQPSQG
jgi:hypothetical protein